MRQSIAKHMRDSIDTSAHVYLASECDMTNIVKFVSKNIRLFLAFGITTYCYARKWLCRFNFFN